MCVFPFSPHNKRYYKQEDQNEIMNIIYIVCYCYAISHVTCLLCGQALRMVWYLWLLITFSIKHWWKK